MKTNTQKCSRIVGAVVSIALWQLASAQPNGGVLSIATPPRITMKAGEVAQVTLSVKVATGYHANSNTPADSFLIPMKLTWNAEPLSAGQVVFPKSQTEKLGFSAKPASVFTGDFNIVTRFKVAADARPGTNSVTGKLHYQACDDRSCLPPVTIEVSVPLEIVARSDAAH
jgi:thiol:disulfide interchange protein DsbD